LIPLSLVALGLVALLSSLVLLSLTTLLDLCGPWGVLSRCSQGRQTKNARSHEETQICFSHHSNSMGETVGGLRRTPLASKGYAQMQFIPRSRQTRAFAIKPPSERDGADR